MLINEVTDREYAAVDLLPSWSEPSENSGKQIADFIKQRANHYFRLLGKNKDWVFYRGYSSNPPGRLAFTQKTREDRGPLDSSDFAHHAMNAMIEAADGIANRSNSVFVTTDETDARKYGYVFVYIPFGYFNYTWGIWKDWVKLANDHSLWIRYFVNPAIFTDEDDKDAFKLLLQKLNTPENYPLSPKLYAEQQLWVKNINFSNADLYNKESLSKFIYTDIGFGSEEMKNKEVMISCKEGIYLNPSFYMNHVKPHLY